MGIDVPNGDALENAPEQPAMATMESKSRKSKVLLAVCCFGLLVAIGLLVGLVPDYGKKTNNMATSNVTPTNTATNTNTNITIESNYFVSDKGPLPINVSLFSPDITKGYSNKEDAQYDFQQLANSIMNGAIIGNANSASNPVVEDGELQSDIMDGAPVANNEAADGAAGGSSANNVNDFETNNQENNVDRADLAKASEDGSLLFVSYGEYLMVFDTVTGDAVKRVQLPPINVTGAGNYGVQPVDELIQTEAASQAEPTDEAGADVSESVAADEAMSGSMPYYYNPKPYIEAISIQGNRIVLVVSGYGQSSMSTLTESPIFYEHLATRIFVYDINNGDIQEPVLTQDIDGYFMNAYAIGNSLHIVTQASLNTWDLLIEPVQRYHFANMTDDEYQAEATRLAQEELIPRFVSKLTDEVWSDGKTNLVRLSLLSDTISSNGTTETEIFSDGLASSLIQIVSFDMTASADSLTFHTTGTFQSNYGGHVYASGEGKIIVATQGYNWMEDRNDSGQTTYLIVFDVNNNLATPIATGTVVGYINSPFSIDFVPGFVRVATTLQFWSNRFFMMEEDAVQVADAAVTVSNGRSSTENQLIVLRIPSQVSDEPAQLEEVGRVKFGKANETITAVRMVSNDYGYVVTFEQTDPFYVLDLTNPRNPKVVGELEIPGFSSYFHPFNDNATILFSVGQNADETGAVTGLQISLFDTQNPNDPRRIFNLEIENEENTFSNSAVEWDERALRFFRVGDIGYLVIPLRIYSYGTVSEGGSDIIDYSTSNTFEGFSVYKVDPSASDQKIEELFRVNHTISSQPEGSYFCSWLPERSFVFQGQIVTLMNQALVSSSLANNGANNWRFELENDSVGLCTW